MPEFLPHHDRIRLRFSRKQAVEPVGVVIGHGSNALEVAITSASTCPTTDRMRRAWQDRLGGRPNPLLLVTLYDSKAAICGPSGDAPPVHSDLSQDQVERICIAALNEPNRHAAHRLLRTILSELDEELLGLRNQGLLATHWLREGLPQRSDWSEAGKKASKILKKRDRELLSGLGYQLEPLAGPAYVLLTKEKRTAVAVFLQKGEAFDQAQQRFTGVSPIVYALAQASRNRLKYVIATAGGRLRLYLTDPSVGVAARGPTETFVEIHLDIIPEEKASYLWLLFSGDALADNGILEEILDRSRDYAADLGSRLRDRIYTDVLPDLSKTIANAVNLDSPTKQDLDNAYGISLTLLFRLLFVAYAEDRELLPYRLNERYYNHSLKRKAHELLSVEREEGKFDPSSSSHWSDVFAIFHAVHNGNSEWNVPEYDGDLFSSDSKILPEGANLEQITLTNDSFGPILSKLLLDRTEDEVVGPVDFRSLGVREFGVIYEGLLESELSIAENPLIIDVNDVYVPASLEDAVVQKGEIYLHNTSGQRKSTGTYYTKDFVVEHLLEYALESALDDHLKRLAKLKDRDAESTFFDFRVADIAMGSGHFLVAAIDRIERRFSEYLSKRTLPGVQEELDRLRSTAIQAIPESEGGVYVDDGALLRRQIARRCIYGVDLNPLSVQLARLSVWIHTFVPGLPLSFLNHNLVCGNSLVGIATFQEAANCIGLEKATLLKFVAAEKLEAIQAELDKLGKLADSDAREIREAREAQANLEEMAAPEGALFDIITSSQLEEGIDAAKVLMDSSTLEELVNSDLHKRATSMLEPLAPFHFPTSFPEVFHEGRRGFDVIVGNPPWEEATLEEDDFWARYVPGLQGLVQRKQERMKQELRRERPDLVEKYREELEKQELLRRVLVSGPFPGIGIGDPDVYKAFAWRFWELVRDGGYVGVVLPRSALCAKGSQMFRKHLLEYGTFNDVTFLLNNRQWVFDNVHPQYTIALCSLQKKSPHRNTKLQVRGPYRSLEEFRRGVQTKPHRFQQDEVLTWTDTGALPLLPTAESVEVFRKLRESSNLSDSTEGQWRALPVTELHATNDKRRSDGVTLMHFVKDQPEGFWPIFKGASFNLWFPDTGGYYAWAEPEVVMEHLQAKRERAYKNVRSAYHEMKSEWIDSREALPCLHPRITFRDVTNRTNRRTVIATLLPPNVFITNTAPYFIWPMGDEKDKAYLLGVLCSIPLDWYSRRFVETHVNFHILNAFPIPRPGRENVLWKRVVELAGRLAASDDRFRRWAKNVGVSCGPLDESEKQERIWELDAVVAHLYGLSEQQLMHIFEVFHEGWDYHERLNRVLRYYREWEDRL